MRRCERLRGSSGSFPARRGARAGSSGSSDGGRGLPCTPSSLLPSVEGVDVALPSLEVLEEKAILRLLRRCLRDLGEDLDVARDLVPLELGAAEVEEAT